MRTDTGQVFRLEEYRPSDYLIPRTSLSFRLAPDTTRVTADLVIARRDGVAARTPLVLDGDGLTLIGVQVDGVPLDPSAFEATPDRLTIPTPPDAQNFRLTVETEI